MKAGKRRPGFAKLRRGEHVAAVQKLKPARQEPHPTEIFELHLNQVFELKIAVRLATVRLGGRDGRVAEGTRLESVHTPKGYRGFESLSLRQNISRKYLARSRLVKIVF